MLNRREVDAGFVERRLREIEQHLAILRLAGELPREALLADRLRLYGAMYALQCAVQGVRAVASQLARGGQTGEEVIKCLTARGVTKNPKPTERLLRITHFEPALVMDIVDHHLGDFALFAAAVVAWMER